MIIIAEMAPLVLVWRRQLVHTVRRGEKIFVGKLTKGLIGRRERYGDNIFHDQERGGVGVGVGLKYWFHDPKSELWYSASRSPVGTLSETEDSIRLDKETDRTVRHDGWQQQFILRWRSVTIIIGGTGLNKYYYHYNTKKGIIIPIIIVQMKGKKNNATHQKQPHEGTYSNKQIQIRTQTRIWIRIRIRTRNG